MQIGIRKCMKFFWTVLEENDDVNRPDVFVIEVLGITVFDTLVLAEQKVRRVAGGVLAGKAVTNLWHLDIGDASVLRFSLC